MYKLIKRSFFTLCSLFLISTVPSISAAWAVTAEEGATGTVVTRTDDTFNITGGQSEGVNLFHSFKQLELQAGQTANIFSDADIINVLGRVVGEAPAFVNGALNVVGDANLFLISPAGIVFGSESQISVPGSFTATAADAMQFMNGGWFNATGDNDYANLTGNPDGVFAFVNSNPGSVANFGTLTARSSVTLLGGRVVNTGEINAFDVDIVAVGGEKLVRIGYRDALSLVLPPDVRSELNSPAQNLRAADIPALLRGGSVTEASGIVVEDGVAKLVSSDTPISDDLGTIVTAGTINSGLYVNAETDVAVGAVDQRFVSPVYINAGRNIVASDYDLSGALIAEAGGDIEWGNIDTSERNQRVSLAADGNVETGFINTGTNFFNDRDQIVRSGDVSITAGESISILSETTDTVLARPSIQTGGQSIRLTAGENITVGGLDTNSTSSPFSNLSAEVVLTAENGDIQIGYIDAGTGGINILAGGSFRAVDSIPFFIGTNGVEAPEFVDYLVSLGFERQAVLGNSPQLTYQRRASLLTRFPANPEERFDPSTFTSSDIPANTNAPIRVRYGDAARSLVNIQEEFFTGTTQILVSGDSTQPFVLAPAYANGIEPFAPEFPDSDVSLRSNFLTTEGTEFAFPSAEFSANASGLSASIAVIDTDNNIFLFGVAENVSFEGIGVVDEGSVVNDVPGRIPSDTSTVVLGERVVNPPVDGEVATRGVIDRADSESENADALCVEEDASSAVGLLTIDEALLVPEADWPLNGRQMDDCDEDDETAAAL